MGDKTGKPAKWAVALATLALFALLGAGYFFSGQLRHTAEGEVRLPQSACDLNRKPCRVILPDGTELTAEISPRPIAAMSPLSVRLLWPDGEAREVRLDLVGVEMEMSMNQTRLQETAPGAYLGQTTLPVCVTGPMRWNAEFILVREQGNIIVPFEFSSGM
ncbi:MAG: hypothetical protein LBQ81_05840 [Zoogloeaceae bacterium]|nr:hypothetical protein [Zoogloeaceae bacterium]